MAAAGSEAAVQRGRAAGARRWASGGPRHGRDVVVVVDVDEFDRLSGGAQDFKAFLTSAPDIDAVGIVRPAEPARRIELDRS